MSGDLANNMLKAVVQSRYRMLTDFFPLIAIFYHYQFRTKKSLEVSLDWPKSAARPCQSKSIHRAAEKVLERRKSFCKYHHLLLLMVPSSDASQCNMCSLRKMRPTSCWVFSW